jgi:hypothetical protein
MVACGLLPVKKRLIGTRIFFPRLGNFLFEALHEPTPRLTWGAVGPIDGRHRYHEALGRRILEADLNQRAACEVCLD